MEGHASSGHQASLVSVAQATPDLRVSFSVRNLLHTVPLKNNWLSGNVMRAV